MDKRAKILCVDDDEEITEFLHDYFRDKGYAPYRAKSGEIALDLVKQHNPEIVLLDISMPVMDGIAVLQEIKKINPAIHVIMVTGISDDAAIKKAEGFGACDYITKPISLEYLEGEVMEKIQATLSGSSGTV